ncbi:hypothetical protein JCM24511_10007 [Saitozyma sp. JCM 24511]|nr:hypothetical protein JCM24511_10007 [Saitozyma sp. JCM 24511]
MAYSPSDERQPLISKHGGPTPLPKAQLGLLFFIRATYPICCYVIFPFINEMLLDVGGVRDPVQAGYRAGLVESLFSLAQLVTIFHWGALSDRIGRKPTLLLGCAGILTGLMNGNVAVLKCALAELTDSTNQAKAVSLFPICLNGGMIAAAVLGGSLANTRGWAIARVIPVFETFPYLLPMVLASLFPLISGTLAFCFLKETLPPKASLVVDELEEVAIEQGVANHQAPKQSKALVRDLETRHIILVVGAFAIMSLTVIALGALLPLFCFTTIEQGGLGMGSQSIGAVISSRSVVVLAIQGILLPMASEPA